MIDKKSSYQVLLEKYNRLFRKYNKLCEVIGSLDYEKKNKEQIRYALFSVLFNNSKE